MFIKADYKGDPFKKVTSLDGSPYITLSGGTRLGNVDRSNKKVNHKKQLKGLYEQNIEKFNDAMQTIE